VKKPKGRPKAVGMLSNLKSFAADGRFGLFFCSLVVVLYVLNNFVVKNAIVQVVLGFFAVFLAPGYLWLDVLSGRTRMNEPSERLVTAIALSIGFVILSTVFISLVLKLPITPNKVVVLIAFLSASGLAARRIFSGKVAVQ
jgi:uncharacterized membrane protein